jgi:hypothetical protein
MDAAVTQKLQDLSDGPILAPAFSLLAANKMVVFKFSQPDSFPQRFLSGGRDD